MRVYRVIFLLPVLMILTAADAATPSGTRQAKGVVDVRSNLNFEWNSDPSTSGTVCDDVKAALCGEMGPQAHEMLGIAPETLAEYVTFELTPFSDPEKARVLGQSTGRLTLSIALDEKAQPLAREFLDKMIAALPGVIDHVQRERLEQEMQRAMQARKELEQQKEQTKESAEILRKMGLNGRSGADISALTRDLDEQTLHMKLDVAALSAERDVLAKTVAQMNADAEQKAHDDPVAIELQKIVDLREKKLELLQALQKVGGNQSATESSDAETSAAEAQVQLLERREAVERAAGGDELADLQKQLVQAEVNLAQDMARVDAIGKESDELNKALDLGTGIDAPPAGVDISDARLAEIRRELGEIPNAVVRVVSEE
jgi:hypothetical protein